MLAPLTLVKPAPAHTPGGDYITNAILGCLVSAQYIRMAVLLDMLPIRWHRQTIWRRLHALEAIGQVVRDPRHPKSGWRLTAQAAILKRAA